MSRIINERESEKRKARVASEARRGCQERRALLRMKSTSDHACERLIDALRRYHHNMKSTGHFVLLGVLYGRSLDNDRRADMS